MRYIFIIFFIILFFSGLYFYSYYKNYKLREGFVSNTNKRCPNLLIQKGTKIYLYNTNLVEVPGVNPIVFNNLEEYTEFLEWQKSVGIRCPVLYLQHSYNAQGEKEYKIRPSIYDYQGGLSSTKPKYPSQYPPQSQLSTITYPEKTLLVDSNHNDMPFNYNSLPGFDSQNQDVGRKTALDIMDNPEYSQGITQNKTIKTDSAMSPFWNPDLAQQHLNEGVYKLNEVAIRVGS